MDVFTSKDKKLYKNKEIALFLIHFVKKKWKQVLKNATALTSNAIKDVIEAMVSLENG